VRTELCQVPAIALRARTTLRVALRGINRLYISPLNEEGGPISVNAPIGEAFEVEDLGVGKVALRAWTGITSRPKVEAAATSWPTVSLLRIGNPWI
jgi:hypothetical protein